MQNVKPLSGKITNENTFYCNIISFTGKFSVNRQQLGRETVYKR